MTNTNLTDITPLIELIITLLGVLITMFLVPWLKTKLNINQWNTLNEYATVFVKAAEMLFNETNAGKKKKEWVLERLTVIAEEHNLKFSADAIEAAIENAVKNMNDNAINDYKSEISE